MWYDDLTLLTGSHQPRCRARLDKRFAGYHTLQLMNRGRVELYFDQHRYELEGAWVWPHGPGPRIRLRAAEPAGWWEHRHLAFRGPAVETWCAAGLWPAAPQRVEDPAAYMALFDECRALLFGDAPHARPRAANLVEQILLRLAAERHAHREPAWLRRVKDTLAGGRVSDFDAVALAAAVGMGASTLRRRFRAATGTSLREWAIAVRLRRAARLLHADGTGVAAVAGRLGYADPSFFCKQFKAHFGMTPAAYRRLRM